MSPLIKYAPPVKGKRELMCRTDEAMVSRVRAPFSSYDGMVERLQAVGIPQRDKVGEIMFNLKFNPRIPGCKYTPCDLMYHLLKFLSLRAAKFRFPDNIVNAAELRLFTRKGTIHSAMYSDFISDDNGVIARRKEAMRKFYKKKSSQEKFKIVTDADNYEKKMNPDLVQLTRNIRRAGFTLCHPEANYHISNGATVFFEIDRINLDGVLDNLSPSEMVSDPATQIVLLMHALVMKDYAIRLSHTSPESYPGSSGIARAPLQKICSILARLQASHPLTFPVLDELMPHEFVKITLEGHKIQSEAEKTHELVKPIPISQLIDPRVVRMLEQQRYPNL